jgi:DNA primase
MKKFPVGLLQQAGLAKAREGSDGHYDTFRNRIMFPIRDEQGRIIAFGGRVMPGSNDPAKYLNSPETPLFSKGRCIYGLDFAKQRIVEQKSVAVVEGYTDVVMAHQFGATNVVSVLGTAMTQQHAGILRRFAERIILLFDPDTAGEVAVNRAVELLLSEEVEIAIASIPGDLDPDEFILTQGAQAFEALLNNAQDVLGYKWRQLMREFGASSGITGQQKSVEQYLEMLASARGSAMIDPLRWGPILARVSRLTGVPQDELNRRFKRSAKRSAPQNEAPQSIPITKPLTASDRAERQVLGALLIEPSLWPRVQRDIEPGQFAGESPRRLAEILWMHHRDEGEPEFNELLGQLDDTELRELAITLVQQTEAMVSLEQTLEKTLAEAMSFLRKARKEVAQPMSDEVEWLRQEAERAKKRTAT